MPSRIFTCTNQSCLRSFRVYEYASPVPAAYNADFKIKCPRCGELHLGDRNTVHLVSELDEEGNR